MLTLPVKKQDLKTKIYMIDAENQRLGKIAAKAAQVLLGKYNVNAVRYIPTSDAIVIKNASKINYTLKRSKKLYYHHTGFPGGLRSETFEQILKKSPRKLIQIAVKGMLPKNRLGRTLIKNMKVHNDDIVIKDAVLITKL